jgi:hypothetical protein
MTRLFVFATLLVLFLTASPAAQQASSPAPQPPKSYEDFLFNTWKALHDKILTMAKDTMLPDDKLGWKPHPDSRSMLEEFRHVTIGLEMSAAQLTGEKFDYPARLKADDAKPKTRASVVGEMEAAVARSYELVKSRPQPRLIFWVDHQAEHYGKLVSNYRAMGIVPPISRPR